MAEADVWGVMGAYNFVNGVQACADPELLQGVLKDEWGFAGLVVSDWGALKDGVGPGRYGLDLEMPGPGTFFGSGRLAELVRAGEVPEAEVEDKARRILRFLDWCGALDGTEDTEVELDTPEQRSVARRSAAASMVLLANDGVLPAGPRGADDGGRRRPQRGGHRGARWRQRQREPLSRGVDPRGAPGAPR